MKITLNQAQEIVDLNGEIHDMKLIREQLLDLPGLGFVGADSRIDLSRRIFGGPQLTRDIMIALGMKPLQFFEYVQQFLSTELDQAIRVAEEKLKGLQS